MVVRLDDAKPVLSPLFDQLWDCVTSAIADYHKLPADERLRHTRRTRSSLINDYMVDNAKKAFASRHPAITFPTIRGRTFMMIGNEFRVAFKKLDSRKCTRNIPTQQALAFVNQLQVPGLSMTNVVVGYQWNLLQTAAKGVFIACPVGQRNEWDIEIKAPIVKPVARIPDYLERSEPEVKVKPKLGAGEGIAQGVQNDE